MRETTIGRLMIDRALPPDLRGVAPTLDAKGIKTLFQALAERHPEQYRAVAKRLMDTARKAAYYSGAMSFDLEDVLSTPEAEAHARRIEQQIQRILAQPKLDPQARRQQIIDVLAKAQPEAAQAIYNAALERGNPLALQVRSGARGNPTQLKSLLGGDYLYVDYKNRQIPVAATRSYSQGLSPAEYFAASFGARKGVWDVKKCLWSETQVRMADGGTRYIRELRPGDQVMGADRRGNRFPARVVARYDHGVRPCYAHEIGDTSLIATADHKILSAVGVDLYQPYPAGHLQPGNLVARAGEAWYSCTIDRVPYRQRVYLGELPTCDIEVEHDDHLFVLASGLIVSNSTADTGYFSKQLSQAAHRLVVTGIDAEQDPDRPVGLPLEVDDPSLIGAYLAWPAAGLPRNTLITPDVQKTLQSRRVAKVLVRSPMVGGPADGGVYQRDLGYREKGGPPPLGDFVGEAAAQALGEKLVQGGLGSKHSGGVAGAAQSVTGFNLLNTLIQSPQQFPGRAAHAPADGRVDAVDEAPQGGHYVHVGTERVYVPAGQEVRVKPGDLVEAGDVLSSGIPSPREIVAHKGLGEGRRYFAQAFHRAYRDAGLTAERANVELLSRGLIDLVRLTEETDDGAPEDLVRYESLAARYEPREDARDLKPASAVGKYLEVPVLHHTIGCFDDQTEALTQRGWVPWPNVTPTDLLATVIDGRLVFERPLALIIAPYTGPLFTFTSRYLDYAVTPNHRFYIAQYHAPRRGFHFETADKLHQTRFRVPQFGFPHTLCGNSKFIKIGDQELEYGDYAELIGWWASEGYARYQRRHGYVTIYQSQTANPAHFARIEALVRRLPYRWHYATNRGKRWGITLMDRALAEHLRAFGTHSHNKRLPRQLLEQSPEVLYRAYEAMMAGDGSSIATPTGDNLRYNTASRGLADDFQELCIRMGLGAIVRQAKPRRQHKPEWYCGVALKRTIAQVRGDVNKNAFSQIPYAGKVYCAEMRTGLLYVRRNGKPMLSGNSRITRSMLPELAEFGVETVRVHDQPPPWQPEFVRNLDLLQHDEDWMTRQLGSNLQKSTLEAARRGRVSDPRGTSFVPAAARRWEFGLQGKTKGYDPRDVPGPRDPGTPLPQAADDGLPREAPEDAHDDLPRDGDGDGRIEDATDRERPDPRRQGLDGVLDAMIRARA